MSQTAPEVIPNTHPPPKGNGACINKENNNPLRPPCDGSSYNATLYEEYKHRPKIISIVFNTAAKIFLNLYREKTFLNSYTFLYEKQK